jgi:hypothetical protein
MITSDKLDEFSAAFLKAQKNMGFAERDGINPRFKSKFSTINAVLKACKEPLNEQGISIIQGLGTSEDGRLVCFTRLQHTSDQFIQCQMSMEADDPQAAGSCATYLKRYLLTAMAVVGSEDDDGEAAQAAHAAKTTKQTETTHAKSTKQETTTLPKFDPKNAEHLKAITAELEKRNITGMWRAQVINAMIGKTKADLPKIIDLCNPELPDLPKDY